MEIEVLHKMQESGYLKAHSYHLFYLAPPVVAYLKSFWRIETMWIIAHGQSVRLCLAEQSFYCIYLFQTAGVNVY
jgi:hypothetical protein